MLRPIQLSTIILSDFETLQHVAGQFSKLFSLIRISGNRGVTCKPEVLGILAAPSALLLACLSHFLEVL